MDLTPEQLEFLRWHGIPLDSLFDATGLQGAALKRAMEAEGKTFAYNTNRCNNGHRLKSRPGHCIQCRPASIGYLKRHFADGYVYVAGSVRGQLIKIGTTQDLARRKQQLRDWQYGGQLDWQMLASAHTDNAGMVEGTAHTKLSRYSVGGEYLRAGRRQRCIELFRCDFDDAKEALEHALSGKDLTIEDHDRARQLYSFRSADEGP